MSAAPLPKCIHIVPLDKIATRQGWQVRARLDDAAIARYATQYRNGTDMEPIRLVRIIGGSGALYVLDGRHRLQAALREALRGLPAVIIDTTEQDGLWLAAEANMKHGVPLKKADYRRVFNAFIKAGRHMKGKRAMSLRDIAGALHGIVAHTTIHGWMRKDFPVLARQHYSADTPSRASADAGPTWKLPNGSWAEAQEHIHSLKAILAGVPEESREGWRESIGVMLGFIEVAEEPSDF
ncbi:ParB/Sulfiredoxin [Rhabdaerophilaceae bacterium]